MTETTSGTQKYSFGKKPELEIGKTYRIDFDGTRLETNYQKPYLGDAEYLGNAEGVIDRMNVFTFVEDREKKYVFLSHHCTVEDEEGVVRQSLESVLSSRSRYLLSPMLISERGIKNIDPNMNPGSDILKVLQDLGVEI